MTLTNKNIDYITLIEVTLKIISIQEGTGKHAGKLGAFQVEGTDDGKFFSLSVGSGLTDEDRDKFWESRDKLIGMLVITNLLLSPILIILDFHLKLKFVNLFHVLSKEHYLR